jgi:type IV pilus assembly protein PilM
MATGIDIGNHVTRVAVADRKGGALRVIGYARVPTAEVLGPEARPGRLREALAAAGVRRGAASISVSGRDVILKISNYPPVPEWRLRLLIEYELSELSERAGGDILSAYRVLDVPGRQGGEYTALLSLAKEPVIDERIGALEEAGLRLETVLPSPIASGNAYALGAAEATGGGTALVADIGEATTDVSLLDGQRLIFARNANFGGAAFVAAVSETFGVKPQTARKMLHEEGALLSDSPGDVQPRTMKVCRALEGPAADLASLLRSSMKFAQAQLRISDMQVGEVILCGGVALLPGLDQFLAGSLRVPVRVWNPAFLAAEGLDSVGLSALRDDGPAAVTAVGLAATSAAGSREAVTVELLPERLERRREFLRSQLFVLLAAGLVCLSSLVWWWTAASNAEVALQDSRVLDRRRQELHELKLGVEEAIEQRLDLLEQRHSWSTTVASGQALSLALDALRRLTPEDAWLTEVTMKPRLRYTAPQVIRVAGMIRESTSSASSTYDEFKRSLEMLPDFRFTTLAMEPDTRGGLTFSFELEFTGPSATAARSAVEGD